MTQHLGWHLLVVLLLIGAAVAVMATRPQRLSLDLRGGRSFSKVETLRRKQTRAGKKVLKVIVVVALLWLAACAGPPARVDRITIVNPTGYDLDVDVAGPERDGWIPAAIVEAGSERVAEEVIDQGEVWVFRFLHWGDPAGELSVTRAELEGDGWQVEVPEEVEARLQQLGRPLSI